MANIDVVIPDLLVTNAAVRAIVDERVRTDIAWQEDDLPLIVCALTGEDKGRHMTGSDGLAQTTFAIDCWAEDRGEAQNLSDAVHNVLQTYRGLTGPPGDEVYIRTCYVTDRRSNLQQKVEGSDEFLRGVGLTFVVWYKTA